ncbi:sodium:alanine symporter family protein [Magnetospira sp. QH-2]|uniref:alanine/glycine:cation symporter family protein n=1 Tax=Magnetospira sp. (strain QH-2) TaxID=1288970 RepID=UPI00130E5CD7|nr:amino acid carrier protein [Magnetospira sp. QH-2]
MPLLYLEIGLLFLFVTRGLVLRNLKRGLRAVWHGRGDANHADDHVSHPKAFLAALAATIGVGNLAGVATGLHLGGPGALFWMWVTALLGMSFRLASTYFAVKLARDGKRPDLFATPMLYMERLLPKPWRFLAVVLAAVMMVKGMVTANLIQANSVAHAVADEVGTSHLIVALALSGAVAAVIIGGAKSILKFSISAAPWMVLGYLGLAWFILLGNPGLTLSAIGDVIRYAFEPYAAAGGVAGYAVMQAMQYGVSRGVFSHGSGIGIAPFWHGANKDHPAMGAYTAAAVPLVDTLVVCTTTGLVILTTGMWTDLTGAFLTVSVFEEMLGGPGRLFVTIALIIFAFTTIVNWAYFSERCFQYLGGTNVKAYRWFFAGVSFLGPFLPVAFVWSLGDILIGMLLLVHLLPLTYLVIRHHKTMMADLRDPERHLNGGAEARRSA